jgi:hypothetical protein
LTGKSFLIYEIKFARLKEESNFERKKGGKNSDKIIKLEKNLII